MDITELDYCLPPERIAQQGLTRRTQSKLMILDRNADTIEHTHFGNIIDYLQPGDCLVLNDTKVIPARFFSSRSTGGRIEGLFLTGTQSRQWLVILKNAARLKINEQLTLSHPDEHHNKADISLRVVEKLGRGHWRLQPDSRRDWLDILTEYGMTPLPPYIRRKPHDPHDPLDRKRYQTVYARRTGSVAAPTAGLHFSDLLLKNIKAKSIDVAHLTLHVGLGTFKPVTADRLEDHVMHIEQYHLDEKNAETINHTIESGHRVVAVGTTAVRTLETLAQGRHVEPDAGTTDIFITPPYTFKVVDALVTNFHLPRSTLLALVFAFAGIDRTKRAYRLAVQHNYRFYSYGDAMLIL